MTSQEIIQGQLGRDVAAQALILEQRMPSAVLALREGEGAPSGPVAPVRRHERASRALGCLSIRDLQSVASVGGCEVRAGSHPARTTSITHQRWSERQTPLAEVHSTSPNITAWTLAIAAAIAAPGTVATFIICLHANGWV